MRVSLLTACTLSALVAWELGRQINYDANSGSAKPSANPDSANAGNPAGPPAYTGGLQAAAAVQPISQSEVFAAEVLGSGRSQPTFATSSSRPQPPSIAAPTVYSLAPTATASPPLQPISQPKVTADSLPLDRIVARSLAVPTQSLQAPLPPTRSEAFLQTRMASPIQIPAQSMPAVTSSPIAPPEHFQIPESSTPVATVATLPSASTLLETDTQEAPFREVATRETVPLEPASLEPEPWAAAPSFTPTGDKALSKTDSVFDSVVNVSSRTAEAATAAEDLLEWIDAAETDIDASLTQFVSDRIGASSPVRSNPGQSDAMVAQLLPAPSSPVPSQSAIPPGFSLPPQRAVPSGATASLDPTYTLGPGDRVKLEVFQVPEYSGDHQVLVDGSLSLPLVGNVPVAGMTIDQASNAIAAEYAPLLRRPLVTLNLLQARPLQVAIAGEVNRPGSYTLPIAENAQFPSVVQALQAAGGVTQAANLRQVQIQRPRRSAPPQLITLNLWDLLQQGNLQQDIALRDGDRIQIPTATNPTLAESNQLAAANFATNTPEPRNVAIVGEVYRPGAYQLEPGSEESKRPTVTQAIQLAGGIKPTADLRQVQIRRATRTGEPQVLDVNLWQLLRQGDLNQDVLLQEGDTVMIPTATALSPEESAQIAAASLSPDVIQVNVVGEVETPGVIQVNPNTPLNQAILAAGGFNERASRGSVELVRLNPNGTATQRSIEVDLANGIDEESNPILRNNDVVVVKRSGAASLSDGIGTILNPILRLLPFRFLF